jgi:hypothetical protein
MHFSRFLSQNMRYWGFLFKKMGTCLLTYAVAGVEYAIAVPKINIVKSACC